VEIVFSRHAKRRAKLYGIPESVITGLLKSMRLRQGENTIVKDVPGISFPLKIVIFVENEIIKIITNYPLKKGRKK